MALTAKKEKKRRKSRNSLWVRGMFILYGAWVILGAWPNDTPYYYKGHEVGDLGCWALVIFGSMALLCGFFYRKPKRKKMFTKQEPSICPQCQQVFLAGKAPDDQMCPECIYPLEPLEDFYERHPELKESKEEYPDTMDDLK